MAVNEMQFLEQLFGDLVKWAKLEFTPIGEYSSKLDHDIPHWSYIVQSIKDICLDIRTLDFRHLIDVMNYVRDYDNCHIYMDLLCRRLFYGSFTWSNFRIFLAHFGFLYVLASKNGEMFLADNFFITTEAYIRLYLQVEIRDTGGWRRFFGSCIRAALKLSPHDLPEDELMAPHLTDKMGTFRVVNASKRALEALTRGRNSSSL